MSRNSLYVRFQQGTVLIAGLVFGAALAEPAAAQVDYAKGKISKNFYRIPYLTGTEVLVTRDYVDHVNPEADDNGAMDMIATTGATKYIVAPADGEIIDVYDGSDDCGCDLAFSGCANTISILHDFGEISTHLHVEQGSADAAGTVMGKCVSQGDILAVEGDVGWTCGEGTEPRGGTCIDERDIPADAGNCFHHLHWKVRRESTDERLNPMTCGPLNEINSNIYGDDEVYVAGECNSTQCATDVFVLDGVYSGYGTFKVVQADASIEADSVSVDDDASVVFHAGSRVTLKPGFHAIPGGYFRAEIGPCNETLASSPPCFNGVDE